jgi:aldose 1-epimerase
MTSLDLIGSRVVREIFDYFPDGAPVERVTLRGAGGFAVAIFTFGAAVQTLHVSDREGRCADIVPAFGREPPDGHARSIPHHRGPHRHRQA